MSLGSASSLDMRPNCLARALTSSCVTRRAPPSLSSSTDAALSSLSWAMVPDDLRSVPLSTSLVWGGCSSHSDPDDTSCHALSSSAPSYPSACSLGSASSLDMPLSLLSALTSSWVMARTLPCEAAAAASARSSFSRRSVSLSLRSVPRSWGLVWGGWSTHAGPEMAPQTDSRSSPS